MSEINLIGGRGYGVFIQTDSRKLNVETGDEILEVSSLNSYFHLRGNRE